MPRTKVGAESVGAVYWSDQALIGIGAVPSGATPFQRGLGQGTGFVILAAVLAGIGVFSITARVVTARRREFGVRVVLGGRLVADV